MFAFEFPTKGSGSTPDVVEESRPVQFAWKVGSEGVLNCCRQVLCRPTVFDGLCWNPNNHPEGVAGPVVVCWEVHVVLVPARVGGWVGLWRSVPQNAEVAEIVVGEVAVLVTMPHL